MRSKGDEAMKKKELIRRSYLFDVEARDTDNGSIITGRPIVYDSVTNIGDMFYETIDKGALNATDLTDVRFLVNHNMDMIPLARSRRNNGNSTMKLTPDLEGLSIEVNIDTENNADARALYSAVKRGDITGMSFAFSVDSESWDDINGVMPTRHITSIASVVEVSAVTWPAYEATEINARSEEVLESAKATLESARRKLGVENLVETRNTNEQELELEKAKFQFKAII